MRTMQKFRAKRIDNGEWVYGAYFENSEELEMSFIIDNCRYSDDNDFDFTGEIVYRKTVGQHVTNNIYEGDILSNPKGEIGKVVYFESGFHLECKRKTGDLFIIPLTDGFIKNKKIIGNIHDNPELLS